MFIRANDMEPKMLKRLIWLAVTGGLALQAARLLARRETTRGRQTRRQSELQRWENEGGNPLPSAAGATPVRRRKAARPL